MEEKVVLVTENDEVLVFLEKQQAHINGLLHRAFSVFLFNSKAKCFKKEFAEKIPFSQSMDQCLLLPSQNE